jgi:hypothetical protein
MKERIVLFFSASSLLIALVYSSETMQFLSGLSYEVGYSVLAVLTGLAANLTSSKLGIRKPREQAKMLDEFTGSLLVRRSLLQTLARLWLWNIAVSFAIILTGFITLGAFPIVWAFLNLGLFSPEISIFKRCIHPWLETAAVTLSAALGIWGGLRLNALLNSPGMIPPSVITLILGLYAISALLETLEIRQTRGF